MEAVFIRLLNMSLTASILAIVVMVLRLGLKKAPKWVHCLMWAMVALRLVLPFSFESPTSLLRDTQVITSDTFITVGSPESPSIPINNEQANLQILQQSVQASLSPAPAESGIELTTVLAVVWIAGMAMMAAYSLFSYLRLRRQVAPSLALTDEIYLCDYIETPFILGIVRPRIYLPTAMDPSSAAHVLAHERSHIRRLDHWWKPLGFVLLTVHWFNPVIWLAYILLCRDIELACDEKVIKEMGCEDKRAYSEALLRCSVPRRMIAACPLAFGEVGVKERVKNVMKFKKPTLWIILAAVVICIVVAVCFLTDPMDDANNWTLAEFQGVSDDDVLSVTLYAWIDYSSGRNQDQQRFLNQGYIDRVMEFLETAGYDPDPVSQDRSEDRPKEYGISLQSGATELSYWFDSEFSEVWIDDGVKPSLSYRMEDSEAVQKFFNSMMSEVSNTTILYPISRISSNNYFDATVLKVSNDYIDVSIQMVFDDNNQSALSSSLNQVVRVYWPNSVMSLLPGDVVRIYSWKQINDSTDMLSFRAYSIQIITHVLPENIRLRIIQELGTDDITFFDAVRGYPLTTEKNKTDCVVGIQYGDQYALGYYSLTNDVPVFNRLVTMDELEATEIDGVFHDPSVQADTYRIYLRTKQIRYGMVSRIASDALGQIRGTDFRPEIHIQYETKGNTATQIVYGVNGIYDILPKFVSYTQKWSGIKLALPAAWEYEIREPETENGGYSIAFRPAGEDGWVVIQYTPGSFAPSGEAQKTEAPKIMNYQYEATAAYCDNSDVWSYIQFHAPYDNYAVVNEGADWLAIQYSDTVMQILRTLNLS